MYPKKLKVIKAPSILGLKQTGVEKAPNVLRQEGFLKNEQLVEVPNLNPYYSNERSKSGILNEKLLREFSLRLLDTVLEAKKQGEFPIVLGGDCSILLGTTSALKLSQPQCGLITLDGHADFYYPHESTTGEAADMDVALVAGHGPNSLVNIHGQGPYIMEENIIHIGQRDQKETREYDSHQIQETDIHCLSLEEIKKNGIEKITTKIKELLLKDSIKEYWLHFDTDVIDDEINPAVDYRLEGGLSIEECKHMLKSILNTQKIAGISISIYNPNLDQERIIAKRIIELFEEELR